MIIACPQCQLRYDASGRTSGSVLRCRCGSALRIPPAEQTAGRLQCPNCGGPVSPDANQCQFCESELAVVCCPGCFHFQFSGGRYCNQCGSELNTPARDATLRDWPCPRCDHRLETRQFRQGPIDGCPACGGVWLDHTVFDHALKQARVEQVSTLSAQDSGIPRALFNNYPVSYLKCPECESLMNRRNFASTSGVIIDTCRAHGVWLDKKELAAILQFVRHGGETRALQKQQLAAQSVKNRTRTAQSERTATKREHDGSIELEDLLDLLSWIRSLF